MSPVGIIGFNAIFISISALFLIFSPSSIIARIGEGLVTVVVSWFLIGNILWFISLYLNHSPFRPRKNLSYTRFVVGWYLSLYSEKYSKWMMCVQDKKNVFAKAVKKAILGKKRILSNQLDWKQMTPSVSGYYWAVLKGQNTMELVYIVQYGKKQSNLHPTIDGNEYSFDCFDCWSERIIPPDVDVAKSKCIE